MKDDPATAYAKRIVAGKIVAGKLVIRACQRHLDDLKRAEFVWDLKEAKRILSFARLLVHYKGPLAGKPFIPDPFQEFILASCVAWKLKATGFRRFRYAYVELARKNAKTFLAAVLMLFFLALDNEGAPEIYSAATKKEQAKIVWNDAVKMAKRSPALRGKFRERYSALERPENDGKFEPLPSDSDKLDGLNPHAVCYDELHAAPDRFLWDQLEDALGARSQPFFLSITTAGYNRHSICYEQRTHAVNVLELEEYVDEGYFAYIACPDPEDLADEHAWKTEKVWQKSNPALGTAKRLEYMRSQVEKAILLPGKENAVKTKQLNIWTQTQTKWLDVYRFEECGRVKLKNYSEAFGLMEGRECYTGLDLSSKVDFSAAVHLFPPTDDDPLWSVLARIWCPEDTMRERERRDRIPAQLWAKQGFLTETSGEIIDHEEIEKALKEDGERFRIKEIGFDPHMATALAVQLDVHGFDMVQMNQTMRVLSAPTKELEAMTLERKFEHFANPVLCWMARNVSVVNDANDNLRPAKDKSADRIDGIVALIMALGRAMVASETESIYESRGARVL